MSRAPSSSRSPPPFYLKAGRPIRDMSGNEYMATRITDMSGAIAHYRAMMLRSAEFTTAPDGFYTWIIKGGAFFAMPVLSNQEVGSVHINMWSWTPELGTVGDEVTAAGELEKSGPVVRFNLKSGTFMERLIQAGHLTKQTVDSMVIPAVKQTLLDLELIPIFSRCDPCNHTYEQISGEDILDSVMILTDTKELAHIRKYFHIESRGKAVDDSEQYKALNAAFGLQAGGRRRSLQKKKRRTRRAQ